MEKFTIDYLRENGLIAYEYVRGSTLYHLSLDNGQSDLDIGGVFIAPYENIVGLRSQYPEQVADDKNDTVFYELGRWVELLLKANPTALESLFVPKDCIIGEVHPAVQYVIDHRDAFVSRECFNTFYGYAVSQIGKARGLNKKIVNPITERKGVLDFCYTTYKQGSSEFKNWLEKRGLLQQYCGLVNIPNMHDMYSVFYDWGNHIKNSGINNGLKKFYEQLYPGKNILDEPMIGYRGIVGTTGEESNEVRLSSVAKGVDPICQLYYNKDGYVSHCRAYREYKEWEAKRNPVRYESNLTKNYDSKNIMHCMRLVRMAKELAQGKGFNVVRTEDREYLLDIRKHKFEYDEVMAQLEKEKAEMEEAIKTTTLKEHNDIDEVSNILFKAREIAYKK